MQKISFDRFNSSAFERLVRSLSFKEFGTGGVVFPPGPDGARDFSFDGKIKPYEAQGWDGYLIVQAKFKETLGTNSQNVAWLRGQLKAEFKKFSDPKSTLKKPEYYIIATNIPLTGADGDTEGRIKKGGYTKIQEEIDNWTSSIGIKNFDVWPADKIEDLLSIHSEIRKSYTAWITAGDILSDLLSSTREKTDFVRILKRSIKTSLRRDQFVRLRDAGNVSDNNVKASQVFVDLPIASHNEALEGSAEFIGEIIEISKNNFSPIQNETEPKNNKFVLLGGPGQGKSTASLFLAQIFRANLLQELPREELDQDTKIIIPGILDRAFIESSKKSIPKRYPAWVSLPRFADRISEARELNKPPPSLLSFISEEISITSDETVDKENLRPLLSKLPWILILDGLDEVPPSGEREAILDAVQNFAIEEAELKADIVTIITSRPQGYNSDLNSNIWTHWQLTSLPAETAIRYAKLLATAYYRDDTDRQGTILKQLESAIKSPITQRLMTSPLQITILLLIVDTGGGVPSSRWTLFNEYFETLKKREKSKGGVTQRVIDKNISHIGPIHQRAGLVLQTDAETAGGAVSAIEIARFESLLERYILAQGYSSESTQTITGELIDLSLHRLVLLSSREEGKISFDVRSLQEYMAAAELTSAPIEIIEKRLELISGKSHWQHVFNIAASRCFSEDGLQFMRNNIINIPRLLETKAEHKVAGNGARLALDMFCDGIATTHPISRRALVRHSLELLNMGTEHYDTRLASLCEPETTREFFEEIKKYTQRKEISISAAAWKLIIDLIKSGNSDAVIFLEKEWPKDEHTLKGLIINGALPICSQEKIEKCGSLIFEMQTTSIIKSSTNIIRRLNESTKEHGEARFKYKNDSRFGVVYLIKNRGHEATILPKTDNPFKLRFNKISDLKQHELPDCEGKMHPEWKALKHAQNFSLAPSADSLAAAILEIHKLELGEALQELVALMPWPIANALHLSEYPNFALPELAKLISEKYYGDIDEWLKAEDRWIENGISENDLKHSAARDWFHNDIGNIGCPAIVSLTMMHNSSESINIVRTLCRIAEECHLNETSRIIFEALTFSCVGIKSEESIHSNWAGRILKIINKSNDKHIGFESLATLRESEWTGPHSETLLSIAPRVIIRYREPLSWGRKAAGPKVKLITSQLVLSSENRPLLVILSILLVLQKSEKEYILKSIEHMDLVVLDSDTPQMRFAINLFAFLCNKISLNDYCDFISTEINTEEFSCFNLLLLTLDVEILNEELLLKLATQLHEKIDDKFQNIKSTIVSKLRKLLDVQNSNISEFDTWHEQMKLPDDLYATLTFKKQSPAEG